MRKRIAVFLIIMSIVFGTCGLTACSENDNKLYIEVKHPVTGEWLNSESGKEKLRWMLPYTGETYPLEVRYVYRGKVVDPEKEKLAHYGNEMTETPSVLGEYTLHYYADVLTPNEKGINTMPFDVHLDIYGKLNMNGNTKVEIQPKTTDYIEISYSYSKNFHFMVPESGTYRFETVDRNIRKKHISIKGVESGIQKNEDENEYVLEVNLEADKNYILSTRVVDPSKWNVASQNDYYEIRTTRIA